LRAVVTHHEHNWPARLCGRGFLDTAVNCNLPRHMTAV
jgi:hypothetical protein